MRMYHPTYGWLQDDHIYERIIGWRTPPVRYVGKLLLPENLYRGDPFGRDMGLGWKPSANGLKFQNSSFPTFGPVIYNEWCNCIVSAIEVVMWDPTHQRQSYRDRAMDAIFNYMSEIKETIKKNYPGAFVIKAGEQTGGCPPKVDCDYVARAAKDGLAFTVGSVELGYSMWESNYNHAKVPLFYSRSIKAVGLGLSAANIAIGGAQIYNQRKIGQPVNAIDVVQFSAGSVGLVASFLNYFGIGGRATATISATTGIFGAVLSIPGSWWNVYKGAYDLEIKSLSTPYYPTDAEIFGEY